MLGDKSLPLRQGATNLVFGEGDPKAKVVFIGEGPGYWEDQKGRPFVGNSGAFLNYLLQSIELPREEVYITNIIHYRPPGNRDPLPLEMAAFKTYLDSIIEIIDPKIVVTLGRFSMAKFLPGVKISAVHGKPRIVNWNGKKIAVIPMYHPAAGLRSTEIKKRTIEDFRVILEILKQIEKEAIEEKEKVEQMSLV